MTISRMLQKGSAAGQLRITRADDGNTGKRAMMTLREFYGMRASMLLAD